MGANLLISFGLMLVACAGYVLWKARRHEAAAEASHPPEGQFLNVNGHRVHVVVRGSGPDLVLIHGASGSTRDMTFELARHLEDRYRLLIFDRPGLGYTDRINRTGATLVEQADLLSIAAAQLGAVKPIVAGQSYGGAVALAWAVHFPDRLSALVPISAVSSIWKTPLDLYYRTVSHPLLGPVVAPFSLPLSATPMSTR